MTAVSRFVLLSFGGAAGAQANPEFTFSLRGPCGTLEAPPGTAYDDGTGGGNDSFFDRRVYSETRQEVSANRPGHTWDVVLTTGENPASYGTSSWSFGLGMKGGLQISDITTSGTASCWRDRGPKCLNRCFDLSELTGSPDGEGPQTDENRGAASAIELDCRGAPAHLPREGSEVVLRLRIFADFPAIEGEVVTGRIFFTTRQGSGPVPLSPLVYWDGMITPEEGNPPLQLENCEVRFVAATTARFIRCDSNDDGRTDISDAVRIFNVLFRGGTPTACPAAADCDGDGERSISDGIYALLHLFNGGAPPPPPFPDCARVLGLDPAACPLGSTRCPPG